jgi:isopentenyldiphosphate isomerase
LFIIDWRRIRRQKSVCPLHWDLSCAEHLQVGESHVDGAYRGAQEELGLVVPDACKPNNPLEVVRGPHLSYSSYPLRRVLDNELVVTFALHVLEFRDSEVEVDGVEVCAHAWESWREVWADMASETPAREYCPWFVEDMRYFVHFITLKGELQEPEERKQSN